MTNEQMTAELATLFAEAEISLRAIFDELEAPIGAIPRSKLRTRLARLAARTADGEISQSATSAVAPSIYSKRYQSALREDISSSFAEIAARAAEISAEQVAAAAEAGYAEASENLNFAGVRYRDELLAALEIALGIAVGAALAAELEARYAGLIADLVTAIAAEVTRGISSGAEAGDLPAAALLRLASLEIRILAIAEDLAHGAESGAGELAASDAAEATEAATGAAGGGRIVKIWRTVGDGRVRAAHAARDGEVREIGERFSGGLRYPGDPAGAAADVARCRCRVEYRRVGDGDA